MSINAQGLNSGAMAMSSGALATGTPTSTVATGAAVSYIIGGLFYSRAAAASIPLPAPSAAGAYTAGAIQSIPIGMKAAFALTVNAAGQFAFFQGPLVDSGDLAPMPAIPSDRAPVGVFTVRATTAAFVPGTTALGTGNAVTYYNVATMPASSLL